MALRSWSKSRSWVRLLCTKLNIKVRNSSDRRNPDGLQADYGRDPEETWAEQTFIKFCDDNRNSDDNKSLDVIGRNVT